MTVTMTPISGSDPVAGSYLTVAESHELGLVIPGSAMAALLTKNDSELAALLLAASWDIDHAMPYQGVRYAADQVRQFPRYQRAYGLSQPHVLNSPTAQLVPPPGAGVWDWDDDANAAIVPERVKLACLHQAASLLDETFRGRLEAIRSGLASQSIGSLSETYLKPADIPGGLSGLCDQAQRLMDYYRARSGGLL